MPHAVATGLPPSLAALIAIGAAVVVWFVGFDPFWAVATVMAMGVAAAAFGRFRFEEEAAWDRSQYEVPPGVRRDVATIARSLTACDRLARPSAVRWMRSLLIPEREDRLARSTAVRRMSALLNAELHDRGLDPADRSDDEAVVALFGPDAIAILHPNDGTPVTTAAVESCLDALDRIRTDSQESR
jgi:hypothetical protein